MKSALSSNFMVPYNLCLYDNLEQEENIPDAIFKATFTINTDHYIFLGLGIRGYPDNDKFGLNVIDLIVSKKDKTNCDFGCGASLTFNPVTYNHSAFYKGFRLYNIVENSDLFCSILTPNYL